MAESDLQNPGVVEPPQGPAPATGAGGTGGLPATAARKTPKSPGRGSRADEVARHLAETGMVAVPAEVAAAIQSAGLGGEQSGAVPDPSSPGGVDEPAPSGASAHKGFNEDDAKLSIESLLDIGNELAADSTASAYAFLGPEAAAKHGEKSKCPPPVRDTITRNGVEVCRRYGVSVPPEILLAAAFAFWWKVVKSNNADAEKLKAHQPAKKDGE
jgi:hypothetical protein